MDSYNILILSAGRRVELVQAFMKAKRSLAISGKILVTEINKYAPAIYHCDKYYLVPKIDSKDFISKIIEICNKNDICLIIPTIDTELSVLSQNKNVIEKLTNAKILISREDIINVCMDKYKTFDFFSENNFGTPKLIDIEIIKNKQYDFPLFIKPFNGSSSINTFKILNEKELNFFMDYVPNPIIQEFASGEEYTIDVFTDFESNPITIVPRKRLATRSGEISKGIVINDKDIIDEVKRMINILKPIGPITIQCIKTPYGLKFIEINPRFGGGAPISIKAGANSPENIYKLLLGENLEFNENYEENLIALRYDQAVFLNSKWNLI